MTADVGLTSFIGPNAAGKSTLLKCVAGILKSNGKITLGDWDLMDTWNDSMRKEIAYMPQEPPNRTSLSVMEVMLLGRLDSLKWKVGDEDIDMAYSALEDLGIEDLAKRPMNELSGGQAQIVMIAQCLVREPKLMMLDEPINNLDLQKQLEMFDILEKVTREKRLTSVMVLHDIGLAARFSDNIVVLSDGEVYSEGPPEEVISEEMLRDVYGIEAIVSKGADGAPRVDPLYSLRSRDRESVKADNPTKTEIKDMMEEGDAI